MKATVSINRTDFDADGTITVIDPTNERIPVKTIVVECPGNESRWVSSWEHRNAVSLGSMNIVNTKPAWKDLSGIEWTINSRTGQIELHSCDSDRMRSNDAKDKSNWRKKQDELIAIGNDTWLE